MNTIFRWGWLGKKGELSKNGVLGQLADLKGRLAKKMGGVFEGD